MRATILLLTVLAVGCAGPRPAAPQAALLGTWVVVDAQNPDGTPYDGVEIASLTISDTHIDVVALPGETAGEEGPYPYTADGDSLRVPNPDRTQVIGYTVGERWLVMDDPEGALYHFRRAEAPPTLADLVGRWRITAIIDPFGEPVSDEGITGLVFDADGTMQPILGPDATADGPERLGVTLVGDTLTTREADDRRDKVTVWLSYDRLSVREREGTLYRFTRD